MSSPRAIIRSNNSASVRECLGNDGAVISPRYRKKTAPRDGEATAGAVSDGTTIRRRSLPWTTAVKVWVMSCGLWAPRVLSLLVTDVPTQGGGGGARLVTRIDRVVAGG